MQAQTCCHNVLQFLLCDISNLFVILVIKPLYCQLSLMKSYMLPSYSSVVIVVCYVSNQYPSYLEVYMYK